MQIQVLGLTRPTGCKSLMLQRILISLFTGPTQTNSAINSLKLFVDLQGAEWWWVQAK